MATQLDEFSEMINSISFLHMSKNQSVTATQDTGGSNSSQHQNHQQQLETASNVFNEINSDVIFFYEENHNNSGSASVNCSESVAMEINNNYTQDGNKNSISNSDFCDAIADTTACNSFNDYLLDGREEVPQLKQIKVNVGIDEDLKMILEMDPSIVGLDEDDNHSDDPKILGLPPISGG